MMLFLLGVKFKTREGRLISNLFRMVPLGGKNLPSGRLLSDGRLTSYLSPLVCHPRSCDSLTFKML